MRLHYHYKEKNWHLRLRKTIRMSDKSHFQMSLKYNRKKRKSSQTFQPPYEKHFVEQIHESACPKEDLTARPPPPLDLSKYSMAKTNPITLQEKFQNIYIERERETDGKMEIE